jgi:hypothetical protein
MRRGETTAQTRRDRTTDGREADGVGPTTGSGPTRTNDTVPGTAPRRSESPDAEEADSQTTGQTTKRHVPDSQSD